LQLQSVSAEAAVDGVVSPLSFSEVVDSAVLVVEPWVDVRFSGALPVPGGELRVMDFKKSM
jgi:hypothetical protein